MLPFPLHCTVNQKMSKRNIEDVDGDVAVQKEKRVKHEVRDCIHLCLIEGDDADVQHYLLPVNPSKEDPEVDVSLLFAAHQSSVRHVLESEQPDTKEYRANAYLLEMVYGESYNQETGDYDPVHYVPPWEKYKVERFIPEMDFFARRGFRCVATTTWRNLGLHS